MKKLLMLLTVLAAGVIAAPSVEARPYHNHGTQTYVSGYTSCGCPIYKQRYIVRYDHCGNPIYAYRVLPVSHGHSCHRNSYRSNNYYHGSSPGYGYTRSGVRIGPVIVSPGYSRRCR